MSQLTCIRYTLCTSSKNTYAIRCVRQLYSSKISTNSHLKSRSTRSFTNFKWFRAQHLQANKIHKITSKRAREKTAATPKTLYETLQHLFHTDTQQTCPFFRLFLNPNSLESFMSRIGNRSYHFVSPKRQNMDLFQQNILNSNEFGSSKRSHLARQHLNADSPYSQRDVRKK